MANKGSALASSFALPTVRRTEVAPKVLDAFVGDVPADEHAEATIDATSATMETRARRTNSRRSASRLRREESGERLAIYLPPELAMELRMLCVRERRSVSDAVTDAVAALVKRRSPKGTQG